MNKEVIEKKMNNNSFGKEIKTIPLGQDSNLVCKWLDRKQEADNGLSLSLNDGLNDIGCIRFQLDDKSIEEEGYENLLYAKIYETFGVYDPKVAAKAVTDCLNCIVAGILEIERQKAMEIMEKYCDDVISLFQEIRPKDIYELMIATKLIILNHLSNSEFIGASGTTSPKVRTIRQTRGIKLSRLFLEFKEKLDKHRKPYQQISVQHNHIYNEGQAIIGSQLNEGGAGKINE